VKSWQTPDRIWRGDALPRAANRTATAMVICRQLQIVGAGRLNIASKPSNQSSAARLACSEPNTLVTAVMKAANSRLAIAIHSEQGAFRPLTIREMSAWTHPWNSRCDC
jgi:hypothetical protein